MAQRDIYGIAVSQGRESSILSDILLPNMYADFEAAADAAESRAEREYPEYDGFIKYWQGQVLCVFYKGSTRTEREYSLEHFTLNY